MPYRRISDPERLQGLLGAVLLIESDLELEVLLHRIVEEACELADAAYGALGVLDPKGRHIVQFVTVGLSDEEVAALGSFPTGRGVLGLLINEAKPIRIADLAAHPTSVGFPPHHPPMHSFLGAPVRVRDEVFGNLYLTEKRGGTEFTDLDLDVIETLAVAAGIAIANARLQAAVSELSVAVDRERIARDMHDTVIQRLYGIGLALQGSLRLAESDVLQARMQGTIEDIDSTIRQVRATIFELGERDERSLGLRDRVITLVEESARGLGFEPKVDFAGPVDSMTDADLVGHLLAVLREALSNVARHAHAHKVDVAVRVGGDELELRVVDDGIGLGEPIPTPGRGIRNMGDRAATLGGSYSLEARTGGGTELRWSAPL